MKGGYFWPVYGEREICFAYHEGRSGKHIAQTLGTDPPPGGGAAPRRLRGLRDVTHKMRAHARAQCWAHSEENSSRPSRSTRTGDAGVEMIGQLYAVEAASVRHNSSAGTPHTGSLPGQADGRPVLRLGRRPIRVPRSAAELTADHCPGLRA